MEQYFLTSHAVGEDEPWLVRFHADVERRLSVAVGRSVKDPIGGRRRPAERDRGAATAACMVAIVSDRYFRDPRCGRDWSVFAARMRLDEARRPGSAAGCVIPVLWRALDDAPPPGIDAPTAPPSPGLYEYMRRHRNSGDDSYLAFVAATARQVLDARERRLAPWPDPEIGRIEPAFGGRAHALRSS